MTDKQEKEFAKLLLRMSDEQVMLLCELILLVKQGAKKEALCALAGLTEDSSQKLLAIFEDR